MAGYPCAWSLLPITTEMDPSVQMLCAAAGTGFAAKGAGSGDSDCSDYSDDDSSGCFTSLSSCFHSMSSEERLSSGNEWYCGNCKQHRQAFKRLDIWRPPSVLVCHLKRFCYHGAGAGGSADAETTKNAGWSNSASHGDGSSSYSVESTSSAITPNPLSSSASTYASMHQVRRSKLSAIIDFPIDEPLDLTKHVKGPSSAPPGQLLYDLFAVSNHSGGLGGGHYTAFAKNCIDEKWYHFNDSRVSPVVGNLREQLATDKAYLLFYKRRESTGEAQ
jgi:ubiquitin carboxyl-terminal hydrolase 4/11/15